jgi:hypothetical protein
MHVTLDGLALDTAEYTEGSNIHFTVFTYGEDSCAALTSILERSDRVLDLRCGDEHRAVRVCEHAIWPPCTRRYGDMMQQHNVQLEAIDHWRRNLAIDRTL